MRNIKSLSVAVLGFLILASGLALWVLGDKTSSSLPLALASTGVLWSPLIWLLGIIVMLSAALVNTLRFKNYIAWILILIVGYLAIFGVLVGVTSLLLP